MTRISNLEQLDMLLEVTDQIDCCISTGAFKSTKSISLNIDEEGNPRDKVNKYIVVNGVYDSEDLLSIESIFDTSITNVGEAMKNGNLFVYDYEWMSLCDESLNKLRTVFSSEEIPR